MLNIFNSIALLVDMRYAGCMIIREIYLERIRPFYDSELIKVISGVRRCGKSTVLVQIISELKARGVEDDQILYINFEDFQFQEITEATALYTYIQQHLKPGKKTYLFIDEIQNVDRFELVINSFRATTDVSIFITGSNSKLLSGELATHLTGRTVNFKIMPFTFREYHDFLRSRGNQRQRSELFEEYLEWGGFPLVAQEEDPRVKHVILSSHYDSIVLKDIIMRNRVASPHTLERVLDYVIANSSTTISGNAIAKSLSDHVQRVSAPTIYDYLRYISEACVCDLVPRYDIRGKAQLSFLEKVYVCDLGFFTMRKNRVKDELGYLFETLCYNELIARGYAVYVGKTQRGEVDFIAERGGKRSYYQVCYLMNSRETVEREFGAFASIADNYPRYVLSMDPVNLSRDGILHLNIIDWLLTDDR